MPVPRRARGVKELQRRSRAMAAQALPPSSPLSRVATHIAASRDAFSLLVRL
jgi:hypothetical protein